MIEEKIKHERLCCHTSPSPVGGGSVSNVRKKKTVSRKGAKAQRKARQE
jgi:hypothetical protein